MKQHRLKKSFAENNPTLRKLKFGEIDHVFCSAKVTNYCLNTNIKSYIEGTEEMMWGYKGTGPYNFAINVLYHFNKGDVAFAKQHAPDFMVDMLTCISRDKSWFITKELIQDWIQEKKRGSANVQ